MPNLYLIRHAESTANIGGISRPDADIELSENGQLQAQALAEQLIIQPTKVITSGVLRTRQTAQPWLDKLGMDAQRENLLNEFSMFDYNLVKGLNGQQRLPYTLRYRRKADPDLRMGEGAETFREFAGRVERFLNSLVGRDDGSVIFTHGMFMRLVAWRLLGKLVDNTEQLQQFNQFLHFSVPNCAVWRLHWQYGREDAGIRVIAADDSSVFKVT